MKSPKIELRPAVVYRTGTITAEDYDEAIRDLNDAKSQLAPDGRPCAVCGDGDHQAWECRFNALVMARRAAWPLRPDMSALNTIARQEEEIARFLIKLHDLDRKIERLEEVYRSALEISERRRQELVKARKALEEAEAVQAYFAAHHPEAREESND